MLAQLFESTTPPLLLLVLLTPSSFPISLPCRDDCSSPFYSLCLQGHSTQDDVRTTMVEQQENHSLRQSADDCLGRLRKLKEHADERLLSSRSFSRAKRKLLVGVVQDVNDNLRTLEAWIKEFDKADQTKSPELLQNASTIFTLLFNSIEKSDSALDSRLRRRRSRLRQGLFRRNRHDSPPVTSVEESNRP